MAAPIQFAYRGTGLSSPVSEYEAQSQVFEAQVEAQQFGSLAPPEEGFLRYLSKNHFASLEQGITGAIAHGNIPFLLGIFNHGDLAGSIIEKLGAYTKKTMEHIRDVLKIDQLDTARLNEIAQEVSWIGSGEGFAPIKTFLLGKILVRLNDLNNESLHIIGTCYSQFMGPNLLVRLLERENEISSMGVFQIAISLSETDMAEAQEVLKRAIQRPLLPETTSSKKLNVIPIIGPRWEEIDPHHLGRYLLLLAQVCDWTALESLTSEQVARIPSEHLGVVLIQIIHHMKQEIHFQENIYRPSIAAKQFSKIWKLIVENVSNATASIVYQAAVGTDYRTQYTDVCNQMRDALAERNRQIL